MVSSRSTSCSHSISLCGGPFWLVDYVVIMATRCREFLAKALWIANGKMRLYWVVKFITLGMDHYMYKGHGGPVQIYIYFFANKNQWRIQAKDFFLRTLWKIFFPKIYRVFVLLACAKTKKCEVVFYLGWRSFFPHFHSLTNLMVHPLVGIVQSHLWDVESLM